MSPTAVGPPPTVIGEDDTKPMIRITNGSPTDEELAAVVAVVAVFAARRSPAVVVAEPNAHRSAWSSGGRLRGPHRPGPGGWRASARPT